MHFELINIPLLVILLMLSAFFSGSETSLFSLSKIRVRRLKIEKVKNSNIVEDLLNSPTELLITILIGNMFANVFASSIAASISINIWGEKGLGISIFIMTAVVVIFCEILPKIIAIKNAKSFALFASPFISMFSKLIFPLRWYLSGLTERTLSRFENGAKRPESDITVRELESAVKLSYSMGGILDKEEAEMIEDVLQLSDKVVKDVMIDKRNMVAFPIDMPVEEMCYAIKEAELSRVPAYEGTPDNVIGILYAKELLKKKLEGYSGLDIRRLLKEPFYVSQDMRLSLLLREFRTRKIHMALVHNKSGKLSGLVTLEDLLEEIIGDIRDKESLLIRIKSKVTGSARQQGDHFGSQTQ
ncbi:MAG: HlyC/CorC family transporter [Candidatus Omnitrophica bacterium]|nr:HlyC/CorC family transporter [Candidatus Omnitrophota bacterium]